MRSPSRSYCLQWTQLSALLDAVESGEDVEITRRGVPVARLTRAACGEL